MWEGMDYEEEMNMKIARLASGSIQHYTPEEQLEAIKRDIKSYREAVILSYPGTEEEMLYNEEQEACPEWKALMAWIDR